MKMVNRFLIDNITNEPFSWFVNLDSFANVSGNISRIRYCSRIEAEAMLAWCRKYILYSNNNNIAEKIDELYEEI